MSAKLSERVIGCAMEVNRILGSGFLEKVYESALAVELSRAGLVFEQQKPISVLYKELVVGEYFCDFIVNDRLILELKAVNVLAPEHEAQVLNYLRATGLKAALLLNFGRTRLGIRRLVLKHDDNNPIGFPLRLLRSLRPIAFYAQTY